MTLRTHKKVIMPSTNGPKRSVLWAILYARVSTDEQGRSGYSLAQQLEALREYASREGYEILEEVVDSDRAVQALIGPVWTVCGTSWLPVVSQWCWHRTAIGFPASLLTTTSCGVSSRNTGRRSAPKR
jgi:hypothetical protein